MTRARMSHFLLRRMRPVLAVVAIATIVGPGPASAEGYTLEPRDNLDVKVAQWLVSERAFVPLEWLTGEHRVDDDGMVDLPIVGRLRARGSTVDELANALTDGLRDSLGIVDGLHVSISVAEYAPIYVVGAVEKPGAYEFSPGLTTLQAVALAGGVRRTETLYSRTDRDAVNALGDHRLAMVERWRSLARLARLEAELTDETSIPMPEELADVPLASELISVELEILQARQDDHRASLEAIADLKNVLTQRIAKLQQEMQLREGLVASTRDEQKAMASLAQRGLAANSRANEVARALTELEARMLELESAVLSAQQQLSEAERDRLNLIGDRRVTIVTELQETRTQLSRLDVQLETAGALYAEAARFGSTVSDLASNSVANRAPTYVLTRPDEGSETTVVQPRERLAPGDVLEVRAPEIENATGIVPGQAPVLTVGSAAASAGLAPATD